jgi:signal-transduction protein with cAMP-binding, CBS, and nucleotidyltransferase domain
MICPSCGYDNLEGSDRCEECMTPLYNLDVRRPGAVRGLARSVMEDKLSQLEQEFLGVPPDASALDVIKKMNEARVGCALVLERGRLVGIFTERDVLNKLVGKAALAQTTAVSDLMSANPETLNENDSVATALNKMSLGRYRHIPIQRADGSYAVTSIKHVLKYIAKEDW